MDLINQKEAAQKAKEEEKEDRMIGFFEYQKIKKENQKGIE